MVFQSQLKVAARAWGKSIEQTADLLRELGALVVEPEPPLVGPPKISGKGKPQRTYDRMGRRLR
jgi:hypothetical protein